MERRIGIATLAATVALAAAWLWREPGAPFSPPDSGLAPEASAVTAALHAAASGVQCTASTLFAGAAPYAMAPPDRALAQLAYSAPRTLAARTGAEPDAGIALYNMLTYCASMPNRDAGPAPAAAAVNCPAIDPATLVRHHRVELLQHAARLGSLDAKLMFIAAAPAVADEFRQSETEDGRTYARELLTDAEAYGQDGARAGSVEAMRFMSRAYASGLFGAADPVRAYLFALPLQTVGDAADRGRLAELGARLDASERQAAWQQAFGCQAADGGSALANPFR